MNAPLQTFGDRTVSMIRAKYEVREARRVVEAAGEGLLAAYKNAFLGHRNGKLSDVQVESLSSAFLRTYEGLPSLVHSRDDERRPTRTRPHALAYSHVRVHALPDDDGLIWLHTSRAQVGRKGGLLEMYRSRYSWVLHAQERIHQRSHLVERGDVAIADALLGNLAILDVLAAARTLDMVVPHVAIPCADGLLCGRFVPWDTESVIGKRFVLDRTHTSGSDIIARDIGVMPWRAMTFVGPMELSDVQRTYAVRWRQIQAAFESFNARTLYEHVYRYSFSVIRIHEESPEPALRHRLVKGAPEMDVLGRMLDFLREPDMARAAGSKTWDVDGLRDTSPIQP